MIANRIGRRDVLRGGLLLGTGLVLAGCGGTGPALPEGNPTVGRNDINPRPREAVRDGGNLRWPIDSLPNNFNYNQVDGTTADVSDMVGATMPLTFTATEDGGTELNADYLTSAALTSSAPQTITYTINPSAAWSDGSPITWRDFEANWRAQNGTDPRYQVSGTTGYRDIVSVTAGVDERQVVVTFGKNFAEWEGLFSPLYPAARIGDPRGFNESYRSGMPLTSGPFTLESVDLTAKTVTLVRDPRWWGTPPKLERIIFRAVDRAAQPDALANNELDFASIASDLNLLLRAQNMPDVVIRNAPSRQWYHITFNGASGAILADRTVRQAVAHAIDRADIARRLIGRIVPDARPAGNHIYTEGTRHYQDNSGALAYDPARAERLLDEQGWVRPSPDGIRAKDGRQLSLRMLYYDAQTNLEIVKSVQNQLGQIGVAVVPLPTPGNEFDRYLTTGNFDLVTFAWGGTPTPLSSAVSIYSSPQGDNVQQNYGRVADPKIDELFTQAIAELDDTRRAALGNQIDQLIWQEAHSVVLFTRPGAVAVRANLANFGAPGLADIDYVNAGFVQ